MGEHAVHYTETYPGPFVYWCKAECSCGWSHTEEGSWPSEARKKAMLVGLDHRKNALDKAPQEYDRFMGWEVE